MEKILDGVEEASQTRALGSKEPNALGIDGLEDDWPSVLKCLLESLSVDQTKEAVKAEYSASQTRITDEKDRSNLQFPEKLAAVATVSSETTS